ncbi:MAG: hypothetical protein K0Q70_1022 [Rhodospirillales bacterium]|jgi:hypothetical protein|nr:hypothetical protein [Rhodospirillales bacterium]
MTMSPLDLLNAADELANMIADSRSALAQGQSVDLSQIEARVAEIYGQVSGSMFTPQDERATLLARLNALLPQLNALEADLTAAHQPAGE